VKLDTFYLIAKCEKLWNSESLNSLSLDGTVAFSLGSVGACGDAAARCDDVTCLMSLLRSPLLIPKRKPRHIFIDLLYAGSEYDGVLRYDTPFLCFFDGTFTTP
jgi:hypothetical protein